MLMHIWQHHWETAYRDRAMSKDMENSDTKHLFKICMEGKWDKVINVYKDEKDAHKTKITRAGDSALHVAVTDGREAVVSELVRLLAADQQSKEALGIMNKRHNTVLHLAASMGTMKMIEDIAEADPSLVSVRNVDGETPLFLAAFHGRKEAFMALHSVCQRVTETPIDYCGRADGDTILHCAIAADRFELAFQIIHLYGDLVNWVNEKGASPLHILATKPSAFKSSSHLGRFEKFIYYGILVEHLKAESSCLELRNTTGKEENNYPENYQTCVDLMMVMKNATSVATNKFPLARYLITLIKKFTRHDQTQTQTQTQNQTQRGDTEAPDNTAASEVETNQSGSEATAWSHPLFPKNYKCCAHFLKFVLVVMLVVFGKGINIFTKIRRKKEKHVWSIQIMNELLKRASMYEYDSSGNGPKLNMENKAQGEETCAYDGDKEDEKIDKGKEIETPLLMAAKNGITEMVEKILELFPVAIHDMDANKKNIVLLAIENRQPHLYQLLLSKKSQKESLFRKVDNEANSALHLAAKLGGYKPWLIPGAALQMYWEIKWYYFVKESMPPRFFGRYNKGSKTPREVFTETHKELVRNGRDWLRQTSESCSVVAALIATVAFASSTTVPGGVREETSIPALGGATAFKIFLISSLLALSCSVTAVVLFLSILTSRYQEDDFGKNLPRKLIFGLTSLFMSITSMLVSFCAGHFLELRNKFRDATLPLYAATCLPVTLFALAQFPLYIDLMWATFRKVPQRSYKAGGRRE